MRDDAIGIFWQDIPRNRRRGGGFTRVMPPIPDTGWTTPTEFPRVKDAKALVVDLETYDPELLKHGPGWARHVGHIVGIAVGVPEGGRWYFPMRHEVEKEYNMDPDRVLAWARDNLCNPSQPKIGANITYDVGWLWEEQIPIAGPLYDVEFAEALLREDAKVNLDDMSERYLGIGKETSALYQWCSDFYGGPVTDGQRRNIYRAPPRLVGPYAESDVDRPIHILNRQWPLLQQLGLMDLFDMENRLIYLMVTMRFAGVRVDLDHIERLRAQLVAELEQIDQEIVDIVGFEVNTSAGASMAEAFDSLGLFYTRTKQGNPSFTADFLESVNHPFAELVTKKKKRSKLLSTFVDGYILNAHVESQVYGSFNQLRSDRSGARSGRFSSTNPNLQNIPIRSKRGKVIRQGFVPDPGHECWRRYDYSQIEYRALAHYAVGPGSDEIRARYNNDPNVDFHLMVRDIIKNTVGLELERPLVKNINFGTTYGMGVRKLSTYLHLAKKEAEALLERIHGAAPFLRATMDACIEEASELGYITTILGRRSQFNFWVPEGYNPEAIPLPYERAILTYRNPKRAYTHKALNRRLQGSAADLLKKAMLDCWEGGVFDETGVPRLTVHDELDFSDPGGKDEAFAEVKRIMETAVTFKVPIKVDLEIGPTWGDVTRQDNA